MHENPLRRVLLLRHGVTDWNVERRWQGRTDVPVNAEGLRQAQVAAAALVRDTQISVIAYSTARRAAQTAYVLKGALDLAGRPPMMVPREDLVEIDVGQWSGLPQAEVLLHDDELARRVGRDGSLRYGETGETLVEVAARARRALDEAVDLLDAGQALVVVTHGAVISALVAHLMGFPAAGVGGVLGSVRNCFWAELSVGADGWLIEKWNVNS